MYFRSKKLILITILILIIIIPLLSSCSAQKGADGPSIGGIPFSEYDEIIFQDNTYKIFKAEDNYFNLGNNNSCFIYYYQEYEKMNSENWIINYYDTYQIITINKTVDPNLLNEIYNKLKPIINEIELSLNLSFELHNDETPLEKEFIIDNTKEYQNLYILDMYIPFRIQNVYEYETYIIYIPVYTFLAYRNNEVVTFIYDENHIYDYDYHNFISSSKITKK